MYETSAHGTCVNAQSLSHSLSLFSFSLSPSFCISFDLSFSFSLWSPFSFFFFSFYHDVARFFRSSPLLLTRKRILSFLFFLPPFDSFFPAFFSYPHRATLPAFRYTGERSVCTRVRVHHEDARYRVVVSTFVACLRYLRPAPFPFHPSYAFCSYSPAVLSFPAVVSFFLSCYTRDSFTLLVVCLFLRRTADSDARKRDADTYRFVRTRYTYIHTCTRTFVPGVL